VSRGAVGGYGPLVPSLFGRIAKFAQSPQGRRLTDQARRYAQDPGTRRKIDGARKRLMDRRKPR
jgi:hypothetical protein